MSCVIIFKEELIVIMIIIIYTGYSKKTYLLSIKRKYKHLLVFNLRDD